MSISKLRKVFQLMLRCLRSGNVTHVFDNSHTRIFLYCYLGVKLEVRVIGPLRVPKTYS